MTIARSAQTLESLVSTDISNAVEALDAQVAGNGDKVAVTVGETGERFTYSEIGRRTDALAASLRERGVNPGDRVAIISETPLTSVISMYGVWKAGAVFAPINPEYSGEFLTYHLNDCGARIVIASPRAAERVAEVRLTIIEHLTVVIDSFDPGRAESRGESLADLTRAGTRPDGTIMFNDPASVIYTSGTTGPAKGVVLSHRWVNQYTWQYRRWVNEDDVIHVDLPMYHVGAAFFNVVRALWVGASISLWERFSASQYWERIAEAGATSSLLLDVMIPWLMQQPDSPAAAENTLRHVHMQPLPATHHDFATRFGIDFVTAGFGQTESGSAIYGLVDQFPDDDGGTPEHAKRGLSRELMRSRAKDDGALIVRGDRPIERGFMGWPSPFLEIEIHDAYGRPCADNTTGELVVRPRIASAIFSLYLGKSDYSLHAFRDLWFHTGDTATRDENGILYFRGRLGDRIRVKGENISAFDIEQRALVHPEIVKAAAIGVPSSQGEEDDIVLFLELIHTSELSSPELMTYMRASLARHMHPHEIKIIDSMPVTQTNKIQKHKLHSLVGRSGSRNER